MIVPRKTNLKAAGPPRPPDSPAPMQATIEPPPFATVAEPAKKRGRPPGSKNAAAPESSYTPEMLTASVNLVFGLLSRVAGAEPEPEELQAIAHLGANVANKRGATKYGDEIMLGLTVLLVTGKMFLVGMDKSKAKASNDESTSGNGGGSGRARIGEIDPGSRVPASS